MNSRCTAFIRDLGRSPTGAMGSTLGSSVGAHWWLLATWGGEPSLELAVLAGSKQSLRFRNIFARLFCPCVPEGVTLQPPWRSRCKIPQVFTPGRAVEAAPPHSGTPCTGLEVTPWGRAALEHFTGRAFCLEVSPHQAGGQRAVPLPRWPWPQPQAQRLNPATAGRATKAVSGIVESWGKKKKNPFPNFLHF